MANRRPEKPSPLSSDGWSKIDPNRDGLRDTPRRVVAALREMTSGYHEQPAHLPSTTFPVDYREIVVLRRIQFTSLCEHHRMPFAGTCSLGYIPAGQVVGLSKLARVVSCFAHRLQIQEQMTTEIADALWEHLRPRGAGVVIAARHVVKGHLDRSRVIEEGANAADYLLTMAIRALDYSVPVHMEFRDYLSALLTADREIRPDDSTYRFRDHVRASFKPYGIEPSSVGGGDEPGIWLPPKEDLSVWPTGKFTSAGTHFESLTRDPEEVFRFIWQNRQALGLMEGVYTRVLSVRPCLRVAPDGFFLRETVAEYMQTVELETRELKAMRIKAPEGMPADTPVTLFGGATVIFDEFGRVKFSTNNRLDNEERQTRRLQYL